MGTHQGLEVVVKVEPQPGDNEDMAISLDHSSTTVSGGGSPPQVVETSSNLYVTQLKDCILQRRRLSSAKAEPNDGATSSELPSPELEDAESPIIFGAQWNNIDSDPNRTIHNDAPMAPMVVDQPNPVPFFNWPALNRAPPIVQPAPAPPIVRRTAHTRQFWKVASDYEETTGGETYKTGGLEHIRVHPKFLHSNATSHKWVLGAVAELLDNAMDEVKKGATFVAVDMVKNPIDNSPMLYLEDNGGGMSPETIRDCMSLGFSNKTKAGNTIGQYGNGFKTSTMRLGADVVVFSRSPATEQRSATQSIGLLSFTFLRDSGYEDIMVPVVDYELKDGNFWTPLYKSNAEKWAKNLNTIAAWCPFSSERALFSQFDNMKERGTKIIIYNLWEDEQGKVELDFDFDPLDIRCRTDQATEDVLEKAESHPYSKHSLLYKYSLRSYAAILYFRHPPGFRIILRGQDVPHHNLEDDLMNPKYHTYKPQGFEGSGDVKMVANVAMGFVKDAYAHLAVQGFNVYHKNRLIKPFWRVWNTAGSDGRGIVGVLEANFVEPAHDKQSFERTNVLARLELRLQQMQKQYWSENCHLVGYVNKKLNRKHRKEAEAAAMAEIIATGGQVERNRFVKQEPLQPRLSVPGFPISTPTVDIASPPVNDMGFQMVYRLSPNTPARPPGFDLGFELPVDRSGPATPEVSTPHQRFQWQGVEADTRESPGESSRSREINYPTMFETPMRVGPGADPATLKEILASVTNSGTELYRLDISKELEDNSLVRARWEKIEKNSGRCMSYEVERTRRLQAQILDVQQETASLSRQFELGRRECDQIRQTIAEERRLHEIEDERNRKSLKEATLRARELEAENNRLRMMDQN
ncbi:hypothetical protein KC19_7G073000 [Ceratodon purpureus]|uniref:Morc S5 domain-containing protein n=2 Tax=Ceratodon purpureus TaxID=3225 RepID=A0A8T0H702_CERPU|nr:hypothetical protein KC19_7G073000 [Ceratodon purpureus]